MSNFTQPRGWLHILFGVLFLLAAGLGFWSIQFEATHGYRPLWLKLPMPLIMALFGLQYWLAPFDGMPQLWRRLGIAFFLGMSALMLISIFA